MMNLANHPLTHPPISRRSPFEFTPQGDVCGSCSLIILCKKEIHLFCSLLTVHNFVLFYWYHHFYHNYFNFGLIALILLCFIPCIFVLGINRKAGYKFSNNNPPKNLPLKPDSYRVLNMNQYWRTQKVSVTSNLV